MDPADQQNQNPTESAPNEVQTETSTSASQEDFLTPTTSPQESILTPPQEQEPVKPSNKLKIIIAVLIALFVLGITGISGLAYAVAYEKIKLNKFPDLQKKVAFAVQSLPFMPKTPKFLLAKTAIAHQDVTKQSFDISLALDSQSLSSGLGLNKIDISAKGALDYTDPKNLKAHLNLFITKDFNIELRKKDAFLYFKINKIPSLLFAFLGIDTQMLSPITNVWIAYDTTPLDTEARKSIQDREVEPLSEEYIEENFEKYFDDKVLAKTKLSQVEDEGLKVYKITVEADAELIDHLGKKLETQPSLQRSPTPTEILGVQTQKLSDVVKKLTWEIYIDKKDYYTRKIIISSELETDETYPSLFMGTGSSLGGPSTTTVAFAAKFDNFGQEVVVNEPSDAITFEEFTKLLSETFGEIYSGLLKESSANP